MDEILLTYFTQVTEIQVLIYVVNVHCFIIFFFYVMRQRILEVIVDLKSHIIYSD